MLKQKDEFSPFGYGLYYLQADADNGGSLNLAKHGRKICLDYNALWQIRRSLIVAGYTSSLNALIMGSLKAL